MRTWAWMLGGLIVWSAHFLGVYLIASVADVVATADDPVWRLAGLAFSGGCVLIACALLWTAVRRLSRHQEQTQPFGHQIAALGAAVALIAIVWQALPTVVGY